MFQFSDDCDLDVEDLLNIPRNEFSDKNTNLKPICEAPQKENNFNNILNDCNDNKLLLSVINDVNLKEKNSKNKNEFKDILDDDFDQSLINFEEPYSNYILPKHKLPMTDSLSNAKLPKIEYERKFPGPAGLIPKKTAFSGAQLTETRNTSYQIQLPTTEISGNSCWQQLLDDIKIISKMEVLLNQNTVASVKRMTIIQNQPRKLQFFAAVIIQIDCSSCDPSVVLRDLTGEIRATFYKDIWEQYHKFLIIGTALLLKQVSVLTISGSRKLYMNVTSNNIIKMYTPQADNLPVLVQNVLPITDQDFIPQVKKKEKIAKETFHNVTTQKTVSSFPNSIKPKSVESNNLKIKNLVSKFELKMNQFPESTLARNQQDNKNHILEKNLISSELEGIDVDSLFGDF